MPFFKFSISFKDRFKRKNTKPIYAAKTIINWNNEAEAASCCIIPTSRVFDVLNTRAQQSRKQKRLHRYVYLINSEKNE